VRFAPVNRRNVRRHNIRGETLNALIFLDSRDLIDVVDYSRPISALALANELRARDAVLLLTMTNVLESTARGPDIQRVADLLRRLEGVPHVFSNHSNISEREFLDAQQAAAVGRAASPTLLLHPSFWRALVPTSIADDPARADFHELLDNLPMADQVAAALMDGRGFSWNLDFAAAMGDVLGGQREVLGAGPPNKELFRYFVGEQLAGFGLEVPDLVAFANWLFRSPEACPGWRLGHESFQELRRDVKVRFKESDTRDLMHIYFIPYVSAATLDAQWREYCARAGRRLAAVGITLPYLQNIHRNLDDLLTRWRPS